MQPVRLVITRFLDDARVRGEAWIAFTRLLISVLAIVRTVALGLGKLEHGGPREWTVVSVCSLSAIYSGWVIRRVQLGTFKADALWTSIIADAAPLYVAVLAEALHPLPGYGGILRAPEFGFFLLALSATALRFRQSLVILGASLYAVMLTSLIWIDYARLRDSFATVLSTSIIVFVGTFVITLALARRVERLVYDGATTAVDAERARQHLGSYISTELATKMMAQENLDLVGEQRDVAVLFSDLRGFTRYAETLSPRQLVSELNAYLNAMLPVISAEGGVVDKYIGDSIMVVFGIPESKPDDAARAIRAARGMQRALITHNHERAKQGLQPLQHGIGIHAGIVVAGNIGTQERLQYTVVGDVVNLASRLESATKDHGVPVLISKDAIDAAQRSGAHVPPMQPLGAISLRGRQAPIEVATFWDGGITKPDLDV
ncbi:MAG: adenylate/guanylate cyclase domain-containing protein [Polyangia bacterium]